MSRRWLTVSLRHAEAPGPEKPALESQWQGTITADTAPLTPAVMEYR